jgi:hypothetical protein
MSRSIFRAGLGCGQPPPSRRSVLYFLQTQRVARARARARARAAASAGAAAGGAVDV